MCYEYDYVFERTRLAEQLRREKKLADELTKQGGTPTPTKPAAPERHVMEQPVPV